MINNNNKKSAQFTQLMSDLFQLKESEAIDYGIYRVIRSHNERIKAFLGRFDGDIFVPGEMEEIINNVLSISQDAKQNALRALFTVLAEFGVNQDDCTHGKTINLKQCVDKAIASNNPSIPKQKQEITRIQAAYESYQSLENSDERKAEIFAKLYEFYSANYEEGDFITQRSYGDNSKSVKRYTPTSGGDVEFHWATEGMYYIKSGDVFADYPVKLPNGKTLTIKMDAEELNETRATLGVKDKAIYTFTENNLTQDEQGNWSLVLGYVKKTAKKDSSAVLDHAGLIASKAGDTEEAIKRALRRYIKRNQSDFFIHQNLREELDTNLEFFVKNQLLVDTKTLETGEPQDIAKHLKTTQAVLAIGKQINAFLGELEDFQKTIWERKKLVLSTNYVITLDKMAEYCGDAFDVLRNEVLANEKQAKEWKDLGLGEYGSVESVQISGDMVDNANGISYKPLPVDTKYFEGTSFKWDLLTAIANGTEQGLDELLNGTLFHSDNWQALNLMQEKYREQVKCTYIDPPYNTGDDGFPYKDGYQRSTWLSMMNDRMNLSRTLMTPASAIFTSINHHSRTELDQVTDVVFGRENRIENLIWSKNTSKNDSKTYSNVHEYITCHAFDKSQAEADHAMFREPKPGAVDVLELAESLSARYVSIEDAQNAIKALYKRHKEEETERLAKEGIAYDEKADPWKGILNYKLCEYRENGVYVDEAIARTQKRGELWVFREGDSSWPNDAPPKENFYTVKHPITGIEHPAPANGWRWPYDHEAETEAISFIKMNADHRIYFGDGSPVRKNAETDLPEYKVPQVKRFLHEAETDVSKSSFVDTTDGTKELNHVMGNRSNFKNPKPPSLMRRFALQTTRKHDYVLDYFCGSGSTIHAVQTIPHEFGLRKFLGVEVGENFENLVVKRTKKLAYAHDWNDGDVKSVNHNGIFFRYHRLEQYEDSLENIATDTLSDLPFDAATSMRYELDKASVTLTHDTITSPFGFTIKALIDGVNSQATDVDLVESMIYLLGLHVDKLYKNGNGIVITGKQNLTDKRITVAFREVETQGTDWVQSVLENHPCDDFYTNQLGDILLDFGDTKPNSIEAVFKGN